MFYVLNFDTHTFATFNLIEGVVEYLKKFSPDDLEYTIEVINCWADGSRMTGTEFIKEVQ